MVAPNRSKIVICRQGWQTKRCVSWLGVDTRDEQLGGADCVCAACAGVAARRNFHGRFSPRGGEAQETGRGPAIRSHVHRWRLELR